MDFLTPSPPLSEINVLKTRKMGGFFAPPLSVDVICVSPFAQLFRLPIEWLLP